VSLCAWFSFSPTTLHFALHTRAQHSRPSSSLLLFLLTHAHTHTNTYRHLFCAHRPHTFQYLDALGETWEGFYSVDILAGVTNASAIPLILGGETEMWGETADSSDVLQTIWPRAAAAAERQWSYDVTTSTPDASVAYRLQAFRCFLLERGIAAAPVTNAEARQAPSGPGSCMTQ
jgi:hypothetical protein